MRNKLRVIRDYFSSYREWIFAVLWMDIMFILFAWLAYPKSFAVLIRLMLLVSAITLLVPVSVFLYQYKKRENAFRHFLPEPNDENEYALCESAPEILHPFIHILGTHLRKQHDKLAQSRNQIADYEEYIEKWVHEIKEPLALMALVLDNRKEEMTPDVFERMQYIKDHIQQNVEQIMYFSRLGTDHKDYYWESVSLLSICKEVTEEHQSLLTEAGFDIIFPSADFKVLSDKKGLLFLIGQAINNSVKYVKKEGTPTLTFQICHDAERKQIILSIIDNGLGIPKSDLPFVFDKGFTGDRGSYINRSTGMGLYLANKMAKDLSIDLAIQSYSGSGTIVILSFPEIKKC